MENIPSVLVHWFERKKKINETSMELNSGSRNNNSNNNNNKYFSFATHLTESNVITKQNSNPSVVYADK